MLDFHGLLIIMVSVWTTGKIFRSMNLPVVFGELLGGIIIGPSVLGLVHADGEVIKVIAELGIFFLMLHAGLETDHEKLLESSKKSAVVALGSIVVPLLLGYLVGTLFGLSTLAAIFVGVCITPSSLPLIARCLKDCKMQKFPLADVSMSSAIVGDIVTLILFSTILGVHGDSFSLLQVIKLLCTSAMFIAGILCIGHYTAPLMNKLFYFGNKAFTMTLIIALCMGLLAEAIGLHMIIGAFLAGLFINAELIDEKTFNKIEDRVYGLSYSFFGPVFFVSLAFHLDFQAVFTAPFFLLCVIAAAIAGKIFGSSLFAYASGFPKNESILMGLVLNCRGAVELVLASIGLELGIIDATVFSILVLMAFGTTILALLTATPFSKRLQTT